MPLLLFVVFFSLFLRFIKTKQLFIAALFFLYSITFVMSMILDSFERQNIEIIPVLYVFIILFFWILPFHKITPDIVANIKFDKKQLVRFAWIMIAIQGIALTGILQRLMVFARLDDFSRVKVLFTEGLYDDVTVNPLVGIAWSFLSLYVINIFLFFVFLKEKWSKLLTILLLLSSTSYLLNDITALGRDAMVFWPLNFMLFYLLFSRSLPHRVNRIIKLGSFICLLVIAAAFIAISFTRFQDGIWEAIISYSGQQLGNFCDAWDIPITPYSILPKTTETLGRNLFGIQSTSGAENAYIALMSRGKIEEYNVFGYFLKEFIWSIGWFGTLLLSYSFYIFAKIIRAGFIKYTDIWSFLILLILFQVPLHGIFYYRQLLMWDLSYILFLGFAIYMHIRIIIKRSVRIPA